MATTPFKLPTFVISNAVNIPAWTDPSNILFADAQYAVSSGSSQVLLCGGFNLNLPQTATVTNITARIKGYRGSFNTTLQLYAVDDSTGIEFSYPYAPPFQGFNGTNTLYTLLPTLFATTWTPDQINNIKVKLIADGELHMDAVELSVQYDLPPVVNPTLNYSGMVGAGFILGETITGGTSGATATIVTNDGIGVLTITNVTGTFLVGETITGSLSFTTAIVAAPGGQVVCCEFVQALPFQLAQSMTSTDLFAYLSSFNYSDGTPIQYADFYDDALIVVDQGKEGLMENMRLTNVEQNYNGTGLCRLSFGNLSNRGLQFQYPYTSALNLIVAHAGTAEVVISNSAPFYDRFLKKCQIDALVSAPIEVLDEGVQLTAHAHSFNFVGNGVVATNIGSDVTVTIAGSGTTPPTVVSTSSATSGNVQVPTLTWSHTSSGLDRLLSVQVSTEQLSTITGITYNGIALAPQVAQVDVPNNLRSEIWTLVAPPIGTYNIIVSLAPDAYVSAGAESYVSVNQASPVGNTTTASGNSNAPSLLLNTTNDNSLVTDSLVTGLLPIVYTVGPGQSLNWNQTINPIVRQGSSSTEAAGTAPDAITMNYTMTQITDWVITAIEINGVPGTSGTDEFVRVSGADTTSGFLQPKLNIRSSDGSITVLETITNPGGNEILDIDITTLGGGGGGTTNLQVDASPDTGTYGSLAGAIDGVNALFTVSLAAYQAGKLIVTLNGLTQNQGGANDFTETNPLIGTFTFNVPPPLLSTIVVEYQTAASVAQTGIQWQDEGVNLGAAGTVDTVDFTGSAVTASRIGNIVTVDILGGSSLPFNVNQVGHGLVVGDVIRSNGVDDEFTTSQADSPANSESVGIVTVVTDANNFTYVSSAVQLSGAFVPVAVAGTTVWLDPLVAGGLTTTEPTAVGHIKRGLGTIIASGTTMYFDIAALAEEITASGGGNGSELKVGVGGVDEITWFNIQIPFTTANSTDPEANAWIVTNVGSTTPMGVTLTNGGFASLTGDMDGLGLNFDDGVTLEYDNPTPKQLIMQGVIHLQATGDYRAGFGFGGTTASQILGAAGTNVAGVCFTNTAAINTWVAYTGTGAARTETAVVLTSGAKYILRIEYDPGNVTPQARFYIDGVLVATHTTNLPTAVNEAIRPCLGNDAIGDDHIDTMSCPSFAVEL